MQSLVKRRQPEKALVELVWNSIDAEANNIEISIERLASGAIDKIKVQDDGHGFNRNDVEAEFGKIGGSWKAKASRTLTGKRALHGRKGKGRLRGFALGADICWTSIAETTEQTGEKSFEETTVTAVLGSPETISSNHREVVQDSVQAGTVFTATNTEQWNFPALENGAAKAELLSNFAPILLNEPGLKIIFDGEELDAQANILDNYVKPFTYGEHDEKSGQMRVIQWRTGNSESILFGPDDEHFIAELSGKDLRAGFKYTAYVISSEIEAENSADLAIADMADSPLNALWIAFKEKFSTYSAQVAQSKRKEKIDKWKSDGAYPYHDAPRTKAEEAEQATFDIVASTISDHISKERKNAKLTLQLLKTAIQNEPDDLSHIIMEVVSLSESDRDTLTNLLQETTLPAIIASANKIAQRSKFLAALESILFDPQNYKVLKERDHLHKILENELWVFGEQYSVMRSEKSLTDLLRVHLNLSGLDDSDVSPVKRLDGRSGRTDLHLAVRDKQFGCTRHLIVELKAPDVKATRTELNQLEDYANAIAENHAFSRANSIWDLILVVNDYDDLTQNRLGDDSNKMGLNQEIKDQGKPFIRTFVRRWADVIEENRQRLTFYSEALEHDPSAQEGMDYVRENYASYLPKALATPDEDVA